MATIRRFEDIQAWQRARELTQEVYSACRSGSLSRDYGLKDQLCRAAVSVMSNIAEGYGRHTRRDFAHFLDLSRASAYEVQSPLYVALDAGHIQRDTFDHLYQLSDATASMIVAFAAYLRRDATNGNARTPVRPHA